MQDNYIGDIGDYGKYGLLRTICEEGLSLSVNWYKVTPRKVGKQEDGKYINYLFAPHSYRSYDPYLFDSLHNIVCVERERNIERIEKENLFSSLCFSDVIGADRLSWHQNALRQTRGSDVVFLDPDNGLETKCMFQKRGATIKHVKWEELRDYYVRGQNVILYQHRPQMMKKEKCIDGIMRFQREFLAADCVMLLEFPKYTNRFYFIFVHKEFEAAFERVCNLMVQRWGENEFCRKIVIGD